MTIYKISEQFDIRFCSVTLYLSIYIYGCNSLHGYSSFLMVTWNAEDITSKQCHQWWHQDFKSEGKVEGKRKCWGVHKNFHPA